MRKAPPCQGANACSAPAGRAIIVLAFRAAAAQFTRKGLTQLPGAATLSESTPALRDAPPPPPPSAAPRLDEERKAGARIGLSSTLGIRFNALLVTPAGESQEETALAAKAVTRGAEAPPRIGPRVPDSILFETDLICGILFAFSQSLSASCSACPPGRRSIPLNSKPRPLPP